MGDLTTTAATELGLAAGTPVLAGGGDASLTGVGAGAVKLGDTHVYVGTSGWVSTVADRRIVDPRTMMATVPGAQPGRYNYFGEQETSGKCFEWAAEHLFRDAPTAPEDLDLASDLVAGGDPTSPEDAAPELIDRLMAAVSAVPAGSGGVLFAPWLHGSRSPFEDPNVRGMFFNVGLTTGQGQLVRSVIEGIAYNKRLLLDAQASESRLARAALRRRRCRLGHDGADPGRRPGPPGRGRRRPAAGGCGGRGAGGCLGARPGRLAARRRRARSGCAAGSSRTRPPATVHDANFAVFRDLYPATKRLFARLNARPSDASRPGRAAR